MKEKIEKINALDAQIKELSGFLDLLNKSNKKSRYSTKLEDKMDEFCYLKVQSILWTGTDTARYECSLNNKQIVNDIKSIILPYLEIKLKDYKTELENLIK